MAENATKAPVKTAVAKPATLNEVAVLKNQLEQSRLENLKNLEFVKDMKAIIKLFVDFKAKVGFPEKLTFMWVVSNYKAIMTLLKETIHILKTKSSDLAAA